MRVSERTLHNWEAGRVRIPYAAYKLIRILRGYELPGDAWKGYRLIGDTLWSPENLPFKAADARWWSLTVCMAHEFKKQTKAQRERLAETSAPAPQTASERTCEGSGPVIVSKQVGFLPFPAAYLLQKPRFTILSPPREGVHSLQSCSGFPLSSIPASNTGCTSHIECTPLFAGGAG